MKWPPSGSSPRRVASGDPRAGVVRRPARDRAVARGRRRALFLEQLEGRALLAVGDLPFGAMPDDTGEYMLGDVRVSVVLMESDASLAPNDNGVINYPGEVPIYYQQENWSDWGAPALASLKRKIEDGVRWWESALNQLPDVADGLLNFRFDWTYFDNPVSTGYEPIARKSDDVGGARPGWVDDFLREVNFTQGPNGFTNIRAWNNFQRKQPGEDGASADWAFTIFVVNDLKDGDDMFSARGSFSQAFSYAGGLFMVVPASRPASTFAHETGHMFWGLDEYDTSVVDYQRHRGYYNTQNINAADNPTPGFFQQPSIMSNGSSLTMSYDNHVMPPSTREMIGWKDSDEDGIFDVLDVPFSLTGTGYYDPASAAYVFSGSTSVGTLPNQNPYDGSIGLQNDITINQIRGVEFKVDDGPWEPYPLGLQQRTYKADLELGIDLSAYEPGEHTIRIRTVDNLTGVMSEEFVGTTLVPTLDADAAISGFVFHDDNLNGAWDIGEMPYPDFGLQIIDDYNQPLDLRRYIEPDFYEAWTSLNTVPDVPGVTLTAIGSSVEAGGPVIAHPKSPTGTDNIFGTYVATAPPANPDDPPTRLAVETWNSSSRKLKVAFDTPVGVVSIHASRVNSKSSTRFARMEAYNAQGELLERVTSAQLPSEGSVRLTLNRPVGDIAYVIVGAHGAWRGLTADTSVVVLDSLEWGAAASATTNPLGAYSFAGYPAGDYRVRATPPYGYMVTTPLGGIASVSVGSGQSAQVNFGIAAIPDHYNPWHNDRNPLNVNGDEQNAVSPLDALIIFNWLNAHPGESYLADLLPEGVFLDVNNDGHCTALDALIIFNYLNGGGGGEGEAAGSAPSNPEGAAGPGPGTPSPEGEEWTRGGQLPRTAAEYYAQEPLHLIPPPESMLPCTCAQCTGVRSVALQQTVAELKQGLGMSVLDSLANSSEATTVSRPTSPVSHHPQAGRKIDLVGLSLLVGDTSPKYSGLRRAAPLDETVDLLAVDVSQADGVTEAKLVRRLARRG